MYERQVNHDLFLLPVEDKQNKIDSRMEFVDRNNNCKNYNGYNNQTDKIDRLKKKCNEASNLNQSKLNDKLNSFDNQSKSKITYFDSSISNNFFRGLNKKFKHRRRTTSLTDLGSKITQQKNGFDCTIANTNDLENSHQEKLQQASLAFQTFKTCINCQNKQKKNSMSLIFFNKTKSSKYLCQLCSINFEQKDYLADQTVPLIPKNYHDDQIQPQICEKNFNIYMPVSNKETQKQEFNSVLFNEENFCDFRNFNNLTFYKQINIITNWFKLMNDENKNSLLSMLLDHCGPVQNHLLSLKIIEPHSDCQPNCCDMISYLPKMISNQIFSYLDHISLANASKVNRVWNELANDSNLWKNFCFLPQWRFSLSTEEKQMKKHLTRNNKIDWKSIFGERFKVKKNWLTGKSLIKTFYGHEEAVSCVQFDETRIVAGSAAGTIKVWNISESNSNSTSTIAQSAFLPYLNLFGHSGTIRCLHLDGDLNRLFSGSADHSIKVWDLSEVHPTWSRVTCKMTFLGHTDTVRCLQVDGTMLISGSYDHTLKIWDLKTGLCTNTLRGHTDSVLCLQFDHEKIISGSADRTIRIWNFDGNCLNQLKGHTGSITCLHFDSQRIISGSLDFDIKFWSIGNGLCINTLNWITKEGHTAAIRCLKADSQKIVSCSDDKTIKIWNIETGERYVTLKNHSDGVTCLQFNDFYILSGSYDRTIKLWDFSAN